VPFGRNRESRSREAAGHRNWPEAVPRKNAWQKEIVYRNQLDGDEAQTRASRHDGMVTHEGFTDYSCTRILPEVASQMEVPSSCESVQRFFSR